MQGLFFALSLLMESEPLFYSRLWLDGCCKQLRESTSLQQELFLDLKLWVKFSGRMPVELRLIVGAVGLPWKSTLQLSLHEVDVRREWVTPKNSEPDPMGRFIYSMYLYSCSEDWQWRTESKIQMGEGKRREGGWRAVLLGNRITVWKIDEQTGLLGCVRQAIKMD